MRWTIQPRSRIGGLAAITAGSGPLVVLLHGVGLRADAWGAQIDALAVDHQVIAFDLPGHGESPGVFDDVAGYVGAIRSALPGPAVVMGHSMGAMIALELAATAGDLVTGFVALNAIFERDAQAAAAVQARAAGLDGVTPADPAATLTRWFGADASPARKACAAWLGTVDPAGYKAAYTAFAHADVPRRAALANLPCPALFITGADEPNSTPAMSQAMAALAPKGRAKIIQGAAHMMPMTHATKVNRALIAFARDAHPAERT